MSTVIISNGAETDPSPEVKGQRLWKTATVNPTTAGEQWRNVDLLPSIVPPAAAGLEIKEAAHTPV